MTSLRPASPRLSRVALGALNMIQENRPMKSPTLEACQVAKTACGGALLVFRMGDFYESFYDDARTLARLCGLLVTIRHDSDVPMCGFPVHQLDRHVKAMVAAGERVAVCDPTGEKPALIATAAVESAAQRTLFAID